MVGDDDLDDESKKLQNLGLNYKSVMPAKEHDYTPPDYVKPSFLLSEVTSKPSARNPFLGGAIFHKRKKQEKGLLVVLEKTEEEVAIYKEGEERGLWSKKTHN
ncbi:conserved hypothetical protein [Ricinus communis]|uniref:Uncharacterized protein n=1 Tax=Ricinus communis TaxID=3988 RepID=B9TA64_RICCO|nr:conserved hypothetical protein [Ricinus communis]